MLAVFLCDELGLDILGRLGVLVLALVVRKALAQTRARDLLLEQVFFVQEQNDRRVHEPLVVADRVEQAQRFVHTIRCLILDENL